MITWPQKLTAALAALVLFPALGALASAVPATPATASTSTPPLIAAVGAENQYADVISQIGGRYVAVTAILSNPNTDPHSFESSPRVANLVRSARLVVQNGLGYDGFMDKIESGSQSSARRVIDVQHLLGVPDSAPNPHLWYRPDTFPAVARAVAAALSHLDPAQAPYFQQNLSVFDASLVPWTSELATIRAAFPGAAVATTEPVADYLLSAAGLDNLTPFGLQAAVMNGTDPSPQDVTTEDQLLSSGRVRVLVYNQQVTDPVTQSFLAIARTHHVPVVGVYETMPTPGYHVASWMLAEADAIDGALAHRTSAPQL